jgi:hypothetical protein
MKAATLSAPSSRIFASSQPAATLPKLSRLIERPFSNQNGCSMCTMSGIGSPPCSCMPLMPPSEAPAIVEPW